MAEASERPADVRVTAQPPAPEDSTAVLAVHTVQEAMFTTTWDALRLPGSLRHSFIYLVPAQHILWRRHITFTTTGVKRAPRPSRTIRMKRRSRTAVEAPTIIHRNGVQCQTFSVHPRRR